MRLGDLARSLLLIFLWVLSLVLFTSAHARTTDDDVRKFEMLAEFDPLRAIKEAEQLWRQVEGSDDKAEQLQILRCFNACRLTPRSGKLYFCIDIERVLHP